MALHSDLQIYKTVFELLKLVAMFCKHMNRDYRQILGGELRDHCLKITILILRALRRHPGGLSTKELASAIGMSPEWTRAAMQPLTSTGQAESFYQGTALKYWRINNTTERNEA